MATKKETGNKQKSNSPEDKKQSGEKNQAADKAPTQKESSAEDKAVKQETTVSKDAPKEKGEAAGKGEAANSADRAPEQEIETLMQALQSDLSQTDPEQALSLVEHWQGFLNKSKEPAAKELASELKELQKLVKSGKGTGHDISEALIRLGEQTAEFADTAEKGVKQLVQRLGKQLRQAGTAIAKEEDQESHQQLDSLLESAEGDTLDSMEPEEAIQIIDRWYTLLQQAEGESFQGLANSLKELKQALKRGNAKPETIGKALTQVGEQTSEVASEVPRGFKGIIQKVGKQLTRTGESLTQGE